MVSFPLKQLFTQVLPHGRFGNVWGAFWCHTYARGSWHWAGTEDAAQHPSVPRMGSQSHAAPKAKSSGSSQSLPDGVRQALL